MANPNLVAATSILGNTGVQRLFVYNQTQFTVPSDHVYKLNSITVANISVDPQTVDLTVSVDGTNYFYLANDINVPVGTTLAFLTKDQSIYIPETGRMKCFCSSGVGAALDLVFSYEDIS
tara:strand:- start:185 stop:544 length:360 start_codon:yes stop_codon:yes gene_type:complete